MNTKPASKNSTSDATLLRQKAEELIKLKFSKPGMDLSEADTLKLIHELQVHQIELELQNEELRMAKEQAEVAFEKYVTERKQTEEELLERNEERFRSLYENAKIGLYRTTPEGTVVLANKALVKMLGYPSFDELAKVNVEHDGFETPSQRKAFIEKIEQTGEVENFESTWIRQDRTPVFVRESAQAIRDSSGNTLYYDGEVEDITERKEIENALRESEKKLKTIFEIMPVGITVLDGDREIVETNDAIEKILDISKDGLLKGLYKSRSYLRADQTLMNTEEYASVRALKEQKAVNNVEIGVVKEDGNVIWTNVSAVPVSFLNWKVVVVTSDITEHKQAEEALKTSEKRLSQFNDLQGLLLPPNHIEEKLKLITEAVVQIMGADFARIWMIKPGDRCEGGCIHALVEKGPHTCRFRDRCLHLMASSGSYTHTNGQVHARVPFGCYKIGKIASGEEAKFLTNNVTTDTHVHDNAWAKELGLVSFAGYRLVDTNGTPLGVLELFSKQAISAEDDSFLEGIAHSTSRVLHSAWAEEALRESEARYRLLFEASGDGILIADVETKTFKYANPAVCRMLGYTEEELKTMGLADIHPRQDLQRVIAEFESQARGEKILAPDIPCLKKDGSIMYADINTTSTMMDGRLCALGLFRDITERKRMEEKLRHAEQQFRLVWEKAADGMRLINEKGTLLMVNEAYCRFVQKEQSELLGKSFAVIYEKEQQDDFVRKHQERFKSRNVETHYERELILWNGRKVWVEVTNSFLELKDQPPILLSIFRDITERKRMEEKLYYERTLFRTIIDLMPDAIYAKDIEGRKTLCNLKEIQLTGRNSEAELIGKTDFDLYPKRVAKHSWDEDKSIIQSGKPILDIESSLIDKDGQVHWQLGSKVPLRDIHGHITGIVGYSHDITERKQAEAVLRDSEHRYRLLIETANEGILVAQNGFLKFVNPMIQVITGRTQRELLILPFIDFIHPEDRELLIKNHMIRLKGEQDIPRYQFRIMRNDGNTRWIEINGIRIDWEGQPATLNMLTDITERKQAEEALQHERTLLRLLIDNVPDLMYTKDTACRKTLVNIADVQNMGVKSESEVLGKDDFAFFSKEMAEKFYADDLSVIQTGQPLINKEEYTLNELGQEKMLLTSKFPLRDQSGQIIGLVGIGRDITERKKAEEELRESEERFRRLFEVSPEAIILIDPNDTKVDWPIVDCNETACKMNGYTREELVGKSIDIVNISAGTPEERAEYLGKLREADILHVETFHRHRDGHIFPIDVSTSLVTFLGREMVLGIDRDITERKLAEEEIRLKNQQLLKLNAEKDKFFSIISHDLRSPFNSFLGLTQVMADDLPSLTMADVQKIAETMSKSATNLYRLLENLLQWSRMQQGSIPFDPELVPLRPIVDESIALALEPAKNKGIEITSDMPGNLRVFADCNILQTVIRNLVSNAVKFTNKGGKVNISARTTRGQNVEIAVKDTGIGMTSKMINNLFRLDVKTSRIGTEGEPSTGLGLILCKEFVEKLGGKIWVKSQEGIGTTFYFTISRSEVHRSEIDSII